MNTPNKLTLFRIFMTIPFLILMFIAFNSKEISYDSFTSIGTISFFISGIIFFIAMITDYIDGYLARKNDQVTTFGKLFDPLADKIITTSAMIMFTLMEIVPFYLVIIFILRDILVDGFRNFAASKKIIISASIYGKIKTMILSIGISIIFIIYPIFSKIFSTFNILQGHYSLFLLSFPIFMAAILSIYSGILYFNQIKKFIVVK